MVIAYPSICLKILGILVDVAFTCVQHKKELSFSVGWAAKLLCFFFMFNNKKTGFVEFPDEALHILVPESFIIFEDADWNCVLDNVSASRSCRLA